MHISLFALSLAYLSYNFYCVIRRIPPVFLEKRLHELRHDVSIEDITTKRWDTPVGALSKFYACSILFGYFGEVDHLIPWQVDHQISWRPVAKNAVEALSKLVNKKYNYW